MVEGFYVMHYAEANPASYKSKISSSQLLIIDIQASQELYCADFSRIMSESPSFSDGEGSETRDLPAALEIESIATEEVQPTVLFPQRRTSLEKVTKTRKQYSEMIETALFQMNETRTGSSRQAILKYIRANYEVGDNASRYLSLAIAKLLEKGRIVRKSGVGGLGKFTLSKEIREAMRKGVKAKSKPKPKPKPKPTKPKTAAKGTKPAKDKGKEKGAESKAKTGKSKAKTNKADEDDEESDKENKPKPKKTTNKNGAKATGGQAKKEEPKATKKTANEKKKAENVKGKGGDKAADKATKESKKTTGSKEKPKAKETKAGQSKAKGKAAAAKEKGNEKESDDDARKKPSQKNTKKMQKKQ